MTNQNSKDENLHANPEQTQTTEQNLDNQMETIQTENNQVKESVDNFAENNHSVEQVVEKTAEELVAELQEKLTQAQAKEQDVLLRSKAEIENIRRRAILDVEKAHKFALEKFAKDLLETIDNLERALATPVEENENLKNLIAGVELTLKGLLKTVENYGVKAVGEIGDKFNPELHHAIKQEPTEGVESDQIVQVLQKGYTLNDRVIRPAMVIISA